ncbi:MAG: integration host factor subunit alpha [Bdellovibrionales bacterium]
MPKKSIVTKMDLSELVYNKIGYTKKFSEDLVEEVLTIIKNKWNSGQGVKIYGFGNFVLKDKKARKGRDPQTGKPLMISARRVLKFHSSKSLRKVFQK